MSVDALFDHDDIVTVYYSSGIKGVGFRERQSKHSEAFDRDRRSSQRILLNNHVVRKMRVDLGRDTGEVKLFGFTLTSRFGPDIVFTPGEIYEQFVPNKAINSYTLEADHVLAAVSSADPYITLKKDLTLDNSFLRYFLPLVFSALFYIFSPKLSLLNLDAIRDITRKKSSAGINYDSLDGLRGLAALMILAIHTGVLDKGSIFGVWLFFCLSGFLLASPFIRHPDKSLSFDYMNNYLLRRCKRIIPMYFVMITCFTLFSGHFVVAIRHYLFLQADGHYWTITQEMFFYLLLPAVMIINSLLVRIRPFLSVLFFTLLIIASNMFLKQDVVRLFGNGASLAPLAGIFFSGILFAVIYKQIETNPRLSRLFSRPFSRTVMAWIGLLLLSVVLAISSTPLNPKMGFDASTHPGWFGFIGALLIFLTVMAKGTLLERIMTLLPLRAMGIVGFSFYLLHPQVISCVRGVSTYFTSYYPTGFVLFILAGGLTYLLSLFTYSYIERPFIALAQKDRKS